MKFHCIFSLVFLNEKLGKIVIVKEKNSPVDWRVFLFYAAQKLTKNLPFKHKGTKYNVYPCGNIESVY